MHTQRISLPLRVCDSFIRSVEVFSRDWCYFLDAARFLFLVLFVFSTEGLPTNGCQRTPASRTMVFQTRLRSFGLITCTLVLMLPLFGSSHPAQMSEQPGVVLLEKFIHAEVGFNWRNITCPLCKAVFTILDIALLVTFFFWFFL